MKSLIRGIISPTHYIFNPARHEGTNFSFKKVAGLAIATFVLYSIYSSYMHSQEDDSFLQWAVKYGGDPPVYDCPPWICTWILEE